MSSSQNTIRRFGISERPTSVYEWLGLAFLRRGWLNVDRLWTVALIAAGDPDFR
ncbi:MAG: hypothetical protein H0W33_02635 [Gammaproteobacteria bacterium]|nr:hypothetical protein [Gammaproteobacteria bacterium]